MRHDGAPCSSEHHLQLFDSSTSLVETVSAFLIEGFRRGEPLLLAVTPEHRELLTRALEDAGISVREAMMASRLVIVDAAQTLGKFMRQDVPSRIAFDEVVGTLVAGLLLGLVETAVARLVDPGLTLAATYTLFLLVLLLRPEGLFGVAQR